MIRPDQEKLHSNLARENLSLPFNYEQFRQSLQDLQHLWITIGGAEDLFISPNFETLTPFFWEELLEMVEKLKKGEVDKGEVADFFITAENIILTLLLAGQENKAELPENTVQEVFTHLRLTDKHEVTADELVAEGKSAYLTLVPNPTKIGLDEAYFDHYAATDEEHHRQVFNDLLAKLNQIPASEFQKHYQENRTELLFKMAELYASGVAIAKAENMNYDEVLAEKKTKTLLNILRWERPIRVGGGDKQVLRDRMLYMLRRLDLASQNPDELTTIRSERPLSNYPLDYILAKYPQVEPEKYLQVIPNWYALSLSGRCTALAENLPQLVGEENQELQQWLTDHAKTFAIVESLLQKVEQEWDRLSAPERYQLVVDFLRQLRQDVKFDDMVLKQG